MSDYKETPRKSNRKRFPCCFTFCGASFRTEDERSEHEEVHIAEKHEKMRLPYPKKRLAFEDTAAIATDQPTSTRRDIGIVLAVPCGICHRSFSTQREMLLHVANEHENNPDDIVSLSVPCCICTSSFTTYEMMLKHVERDHSESPEGIDQTNAQIIGAATTTVSQKRAECTSLQNAPSCKKPRVEHNGTASTSNNTPTRIRRQILDRSVGEFNVSSSNSPVPSPAAELSIRMPMLSAEPPATSSQLIVAAPKTPILIPTPMLNRNSEGSRFAASFNVPNSNVAAPTVESHNRRTFTPLPFISRASRSLDNLNVSGVVEERIQLSHLPLSMGILTMDTANELIAVWTDSLDDDVLVAVHLKAGSAILLVKELDTLNLSEKQKELINTSNNFTFVVVQDNEAYELWTVITFGAGNSPTVLKRKMIKEYAEVEVLLSQHAEDNGMTLINSLRYSKNGLFTDLAQKLVKNIVAFNH